MGDGLGKGGILKVKIKHIINMWRQRIVKLENTTRSLLYNKKQAGRRSGSIKTTEIDFYFKFKLEIDHIWRY